MPAENTLLKFGVRPIDSPQGPLHQPKYKYRFRVTFSNIGRGGPYLDGLYISLNTNTVNLPAVSHEKITVHSYNSQAHYAGKHSWNDISLSVRDNITNEVSRIVDAQVQSQVDHYEQTGARAGINYKFTMYIQTMDGSNDQVVDTWECQGCYLQAADYGDLSYSESAGREIKLTIVYDNAVHYAADASDRLMLPANFPTTGATL